MLAKYVPLAMAAMALWMAGAELMHPSGNWGWFTAWAGTALLYIGVHIALH